MKNKQLIDYKEVLAKEVGFDPSEWKAMKELSIQMVSDMFDYMEQIPDMPVWAPTPKRVKSHFDEPIPTAPTSVEDVYKEFQQYVQPHAKGNLHPRFWSWVQGTGTPLAMMAEMLAAGLNPDVCTGDHAAMYVEEQVIEWLKTLMGFPESASGILVTGTSMANLTGLLVARDGHTDQKVRELGLHNYQSQLVLYASSETHICITKAADIMGLGQNAVRIIPATKDYKMDIELLAKTIQEDRMKGYQPFCVVANVGTVNTGAIDPLEEISMICKQEELWMHVDGAFGAFALLVPEFQQELQAMSKADSLAFDLHKWMSLPFGTGCLLVRDKRLHRQAFALQPNYLQVHERGVAAGPEPIFNYGIEMTRGFRALKIWMMLKEQGIKKIGKVIRQNIAQTYYLQHLIETEPLLEMMAPVTMNIACFRYNPGHGIEEERLNKLNKEIVMALQEEGTASTSHVILSGRYGLRIANVNHRSRKEDFEILVKAVVRIGNIAKHQIYNV